MLRAVLDANVYVSALLHPEGPPGQILQRLLRDAAFVVVLSPPIMEEVLRALNYPKVRRFLHEGVQPEPWFEDVAVLADMVGGDLALPGICPDPDDAKYLAAALEGRAAYVVTGDRQFLGLGEHEGVSIVTPRAFLNLLRA
ncbi:MAG: putative toxin-antitoxin system toxin component, PIN family [Planctomycetes bacterium]|nr:putative toxin-antitoxin system toxin component, PIN family [Planctomycetota bacterium]